MQYENAIGWTVGSDADRYGIILHTVDGGNIWKKDKTELDGTKFSLESVSAVNEKTAWAVGYDIHGNGVILCTTDGKYWKKQKVPEECTVSLGGVSAVNEKTAWAVGYDAAGNGIILCTTNGESWAPQKDPTIPRAELQGVYAIDAKTVWVTGGPNQGYGTILRTTDGKHWERLGYKSQKEGDGGLPNYTILGVSPFDIHTAWAVGSHNAYILHTKDSGKTWTDQVKHAPRDANGITLLKDKSTGKPTGWAVEDHDNIFHTEDGEKWEPQENPSSGNFLLDVSALDEKTAWVVGTAESGEGGVILRTTNGKDWEKQYYKKDGKIVKVQLSGVCFVI